MLTFSERISAVEALLATIAHDYSTALSTDAELAAVIDGIGDRVKVIKERVKTLENAINITRENLSTANG